MFLLFGVQHLLEKLCNTRGRNVFTVRSLDMGLSLEVEDGNETCDHGGLAVDSVHAFEVIWSF